MASLEDFETILKEVVQAKRLSASKMGRMTEIALKFMDHDTQLVSILYRTHKNLPPAAKVSSLYVFDALSRAARHQVNKQGLSGDVNSTHSNSATFLLKVEGVLEGLFQDMILVGSPESKEKTKKILDIWVKGNTFPSTILARLMDVVKETEKVPEMKPLTTFDPRTNAQPVVTPPMSGESSTSPTMDPQATLLALLTQAASAAAAAPSPQSAQIVANTGFVAPGLDAKQLAVLQQLALAQTTSSAAPSVPSKAGPHTVLAHAHTPTGSAYPTPPSLRDESYNSLHKDRSHDRRRSPERVKPYGDQPDERINFRGGSRGGPFRGRGRGDTRSNRWDDRDRDRYMDRERDWNPPHRGRRSRSRSPPNRHGGRRDMRPYSPPRRPSPTPTMPRGQRETFNSAVVDTEKDEFGRDIRPQSPDSDSVPTHKNETAQSPPPTSNNSEYPSHREHSAIESPSAITSNNERMSLSPLVAANTSSTPSVPIISNTVSANLGMENFDPLTFNFTSPSSWEALGKMWQVTHGYLPTTEQLMEFVMSSAQSPMVTQEVPENTWSQQPGQVWRGGGRGRGGFARGRGGFGNGNARSVQEERSHNNSHQPTDAIVLGETTNSDIPDVNYGQNSPQDRGGGPGGRMQRLGDKWVFVRDPTMGVS
ncbi:hypothetical protein BDZ94DRAFT_1252143 [Collybia nuda]|uniref:CID domain-containing protein n=1 Tax=Collybia nuda TaxID=64659 RepID=A0A9P6CH72_9AGAR|nr:hypothetical protein BDZ94DRAFT_1252143 [Collybia nuda]